MLRSSKLRWATISHVAFPTASPSVTGPAGRRSEGWRCPRAEGTLLERCGPYSYDRPKEEISGTITGAAHDANLDAEYARATEHWSPRVVGNTNGQYLKIARVKGELIWHSHADEDELFMVYKGAFGLRYRDGREVILRPGDVHVVPCGVEHLPFATEEALIMFFEPAATKHTGDVVSEITRTVSEQIAHLK
jgi:mannose-6-phosphate isomerase-like protein (cupin superfamily)